MALHLPSDVWHWRRRVTEFRALADSVDGDEAKAAMLRMAAHYEQLAKRAEELSAQMRPTMALSVFKPADAR